MSQKNDMGRMGAPTCAPFRAVLYIRAVRGMAFWFLNTPAATMEVKEAPLETLSAGFPL